VLSVQNKTDECVLTVAEVGGVVGTGGGCSMVRRSIHFHGGLKQEIPKTGERRKMPRGFVKHAPWKKRIQGDVKRRSRAGSPFIRGANLGHRETEKRLPEPKGPNLSEKDWDEKMTGISCRES